MLPGNVWAYIWPLALILFGALVLLGVVRRRSFEVVRATLPLDNAETARVSISHGAGELRVAAGDTPNALVDGFTVETNALLDPLGAGTYVMRV